MIRIAVDAMSGDLGPRSAILAALTLVQAEPDLRIILVGPRTELQSLLSEFNSPSSISVHHAPDRVSMDEDPRAALRHKQDSSMWRALALVQKGEADACVSAGNTGALMAMSRFLLKTLPGIERPAICKLMPVTQGFCYMLDLGANTQCSAEQLHQFALMGNILARLKHQASGQKVQPRVGLLNVGVEPGKGNDLVRAADLLLRADQRLNYIGFIEADGIYHGAAEVVVCDGFSGNIALKASEGVARLITHKIEASLKRHWWRKLLGGFIYPLLRAWRSELNPAAYNGAIFIGLQKPVIKSHGGADQLAFAQALKVAIAQVREPVAASIAEQLA